MSKPEFQIGDIVRLKSGGPDMVVQRRGVPQNSEVSPEVYSCVWFPIVAVTGPGGPIAIPGTDPHADDFIPEILEKVNRS